LSVGRETVVYYATAASDGAAAADASLMRRLMCISYADIMQLDRCFSEQTSLLKDAWSYGHWTVCSADDVSAGLASR